jgi:hypothetical protein
VSGKAKKAAQRPTVAWQHFRPDFNPDSADSLSDASSTGADAAEGIAGEDTPGLRRYRARAAMLKPMPALTTLSERYRSPHEFQQLFPPSLASYTHAPAINALVDAGVLHVPEKKASDKGGCACVASMPMPELAAQLQQAHLDGVDITHAVPGIKPSALSKLVVLEARMSQCCRDLQEAFLSKDSVDTDAPKPKRNLAMSLVNNIALASQVKDSTAKSSYIQVAGEYWQWWAQNKDEFLK